MKSSGIGDPNRKKCNVIDTEEYLGMIKSPNTNYDTSSIPITNTLKHRLISHSRTNLPAL